MKKHMNLFAGCVHCTIGCFSAILSGALLVSGYVTQGLVFLLIALIFGYMAINYFKEF